MCAMEGGNNENIIRIVFLAYYYMYDTNRQLLLTHISILTVFVFISNTDVWFMETNDMDKYNYKLRWTALGI